jgi:DNA-binding NtrC family response regulator
MQGEILLVDDDPDSLVVLKTVLDSEGYTVHAATNLDDAIAAVEKQEVELAIIDFVMPGCRGDLMAKVLKMVDENLQIIFLSGHEDIYKVVDKLDFTVIDIFIKPESVDELLTTIRSVFSIENDHNRRIVVQRDAV